MNIFVLVSLARGSRRAVGAFSSKEKADSDAGEFNITDSEVALFELPEETIGTPELIHVAHKPAGGGLYLITGYYLKKFEATLSKGEGGYVRSLKVIQPDPAALDENLPSPKFRSRGTTPPFIAVEVEEKKSFADRKRAGRRKSMIVLSSAIGILLAANVLFYLRSPAIEFAEHAVSVEWLPEEANDISYYLTPRVRVFEFQISEPGFLSWIKGQGPSAAEIGRRPVRVTRYTFDADVQIPGLEMHPEKKQFEMWNAFIKAEIEDGYTIKDNSDSETTVTTGGYNRTKNRAYYRSKTR